ncbi:MAG: sigma 54-dependent Fis family transcriptional regulator [Deltaproteobacteria bacterium]|nr:sigma 54-dependent Fis family transcriptional regulator [Deltaproteobacteria bacterium]
MTSGPDEGQSIESEKDVVRIGSVAGNDLVVRDPAVSRYHLEVHKRDGEYVIKDNGSTNGTFVGALRVKEATIRRRGEIQIGDSTLLFEPSDTELVVEPSGAERCVDLVGRSVPMREIYTVIERVAPTELTILVTGETGTGKELVARALHAKSRRKAGPFVTLDCSALPPTLIESALFGHEKGAFTGADQAYAGVFERADGGTLFLDELGELPLELQPKLLRALERGEIQRLRGDKTIRVDVRVIGATNRDLHKMVQDGTFRGDLYYRLAVIRIELPALRQRLLDLPVIVEEFFRRYGAELSETGAKAFRLGPGAVAALETYDWPGNIRELMNVLRRAAVFARGDEITVADLPEEISGGKDRAKSGSASGSHAVALPDASVPFKDAKAKVLDAFERQYLQDLLLRHKQNISKAAREAGIDRRHLYRLLDKYEIDAADRED